MTDKTVNQLNLIVSLQTTDLFYVLRPGFPDLDYKASGQQVLDLISPTIALVGHTGNYSDLLGKPTLGTIASQNFNAVNITGGIITGMPLPSVGSDVATKDYVDTIASGLTELGSSKVATTANLTATYNNGSSGVGATLTNSGTLVALSIDSTSLSVNDVVLVKDQTTQFQNGVYYVTVVGNGSTAWVLAEVSNFNSSSNITAGSYTIIVTGTVNKATFWVETGIGPFTIGSTSIMFTELGIASPSLTFTGDVTGTGTSSIALSIASSSVANSKLLQVPAHTSKGNNTNITGFVQDLTSTQVTADLKLFSATAQGVVPASGGGSATFLRSDGAWASGPAGANPVLGPISSVINTIVKWGNTGGSTLIDSDVLIDNGDNISGLNSITIPNLGLLVNDISGLYTLQITPGSSFTANRILNINTGDSNRNMTLNGNISLNPSNSVDTTTTNLLIDCGDSQHL